MSFAPGTYNTWITIVGVNGCGKTTRGREVAKEHAELGVRVFVHDPDGQFRPWPLYTVRSWERAAGEAHRRGQPFPLIARFETEDPLAVLELAQRSAAAANFSHPSLVVIDEGSLLADRQRRERLDQGLLELMARRRNLATGVVTLYQSPTMLHYYNLSQATELDLFRVEDDYQARYLARFIPERATLVDGRVVSRAAIVERLPYLERGEFYAVKKGFAEAGLREESSSDA